MAETNTKCPGQAKVDNKAEAQSLSKRKRKEKQRHRDTSK
jgi:hypothetical protein